MEFGKETVANPPACSHMLFWQAMEERAQCAQFMTELSIESWNREIWLLLKVFVCEQLPAWSHQTSMAGVVAYYRRKG